MKVNEAMTTSLQTCNAQSSLHDIAHKMWQADCGAVPVVDENNKPIGIVTDRDIAMAAMLNSKPLWDLTAASVIQQQQLRCCGQNDSVEECLRMMERYQVRRIPVTDDAGKLCGIMTMGDAMALTSPDEKNAPKLASCALGMLRQVSRHHLAAHQEVARVN